MESSTFWETAQFLANRAGWSLYAHKTHHVNLNSSTVEERKKE